jgi:RNA-directed DNA polymerase
MRRRPKTKASEFKHSEFPYRFYLLYDKVYRADILAHAYALSKQHGGVPGVDGVTFEGIETAGLEPWLAAVQEALRTEAYKHDVIPETLRPSR